VLANGVKLDAVLDPLALKAEEYDAEGGVESKLPVSTAELEVIGEVVSTMGVDGSVFGSPPSQLLKKLSVRGLGGPVDKEVESSCNSKIQYGTFQVLQTMNGH